MANEPRFAALPPARIVSMLADEGTYLASESSIRRVLRDLGQSWHRGRAKERNPSRCSGRTRDWSPIDAVTLDPERDATITAAPIAEQKTSVAA